MQTQAWQYKEWINSRELAEYLGKTLAGARRWAWRNGVLRSPSDMHLISKASVDVILRNGPRNNSE
jgi:adenylate cyclase